VVVVVKMSEVYLWAGASMIVGPILLVIGRWFYLMHEQDVGLFWVFVIFLGYLGLMGLFMSLHEAAKRKERGY
jgi:ABC-type multidrug transport system permease subunit